MQLLLLALSLGTVAGIEAPGLTPCQQCCAPGGDCSRAYKGAPGKCCGTISGQAFCCPFGTSAAGTSQSAKCYNCGETYRCFTGTAARNICGPSSHSHSWHRAARYDDSSDAFGNIIQLVFLLCFFGIVVRTCFMQPPSQAVVFDQFGKPVGGVPQGVPVMASAHPHYGYGYCNPGYGGAAVASSAATGFLGGMMVSEMMHAPHHHSDYGDYGGGDYGGGGDFGGGDGGFAADS